MGLGHVKMAQWTWHDTLQLHTPLTYGGIPYTNIYIQM